MLWRRARASSMVIKLFVGHCSGGSRISQKRGANSGGGAPTYCHCTDTLFWTSGDIWPECIRECGLLLPHLQSIMEHSDSPL